MVIEELIAKLGLKFSGGNDAAKFIRELDRIKRATKDVSKGLNVGLNARTTGLSRISGDADRAARSLRAMRREAERAARVKFGTVGIPGPSPTGGRGPGAGRVAARAAETGGGGLNLVATLGGVVTSLNRFGTLEAAQIELAKTTEKTKAETQPAVDRFLIEGPKYGTTGKALVGAASAYAAAGVDYDTSIASAELTAKAAKAGSVEIDKAAQAAIVFMQNLGVKVEQLETAFDYSIKGGKLGKAEFKESAGVMPELAASGAKIGLEGLKGVRDIIAALTVVREGTATTAQAADFLRDFMEKMSAPVTVKAFKKAGIDIEREMKDADKGGVSRMDRTLDLAARYSKGDAFREAEIFGDLQARNAMSGLLKKRDKYEEFKSTIEREAPGTMQADLAKTMDGFNSSVERAGATLDRVFVRLGEMMAPTAKAILDVGSAAQQAAADGKGSTSAETNATVEKLNRLLGAPPTYKRILGEYGGITAKDFNERYAGAAEPSKLTFSLPQVQAVAAILDKRSAPVAQAADSAAKPAPVVQPASPAQAQKPTFSPQAQGMTPPTFGSPADRMNWLSKGAAGGTTITNTYTDTGNDHRTQTVNIHQTVNDQAQVAQAAATAAKNAISSMGASIVKGGSASTGAANAP
ncbi:phage tail tape measure protein [Methylobacterium sp. Leaf85]|uniref:phage tail tape measure protein n=1 Tax=Methylobacterium sp. Leaf85 TaxID=1736241 RepID=UPI0006F330F4|nr:phage tail tape measure protein [Methylobacterium sp. Leaf85]KQO49946.1 hypothetical protein ASF08_22675 [Methylobacterium sp. Leaf85]